MKEEHEKFAYRRSYELARFEAYLILTPHFDKDKEVFVNDVYPFPWEEEKSQKKQSPEEMKREIKKMALFFGTKPKQEKSSVIKKE